jgi:alcohol dehydrogenase class IV
MSDIEYVYPGLACTIASGASEIDRLGVHLDALGVQRAMVVCGPNILGSSDVVHRVERAVGERLVGRFSDVAPHSPVDVLRTALAAARRVMPDALISVGGGSTVTIAQGLALLLSTDRDLKDFATRFEPPDRVLAPLMELPEVTTRVIAIPTTMGGAEIGYAVGGFADETRSHKIIVGGDGRTSPRMIIIDGQALQTTPRSILAGTAIGQLRVAIECYASRAHNPMSDALALHAIRTLTQTLRRGWKDDASFLLRVKSAAALASMGQAAMGMGPGKLGVNSAIAHQLGAICHLAHGDANAILLPHTIAFNARALDERFLPMAEAMAVTTSGRTVEGVARDVSELVALLSSALGVPARLRDVGVAPELFERIATATLGDRTIATNPVPITDTMQIIGLLRQAW